ncbi:MAG: uncharacterized protein RL139_1255 [Gemmatimonadota bacterium]|jgi:hypothetical protein
MVAAAANSPHLDLSRLGGTDMPGVLAHYFPRIRAGLPKWCPSAFAIYSRIVDGRAPRESTAYMEDGKEFERPTFARWLRRTERDPAAWEWAGDASMNSPTRPWQRISPDAINDTSREVADMKFPQMWDEIVAMREGDLPDIYAIQVMTYVEALDFERGYIVPLIAGEESTEITVERNDALCAAIAKYGEAFWHEHILARRPPRIDGSEHATNAIAWRWSHPGPARPPREATPAEIELDRAAREADAIAKAAVERADALKNQYREAIADADAILVPRGEKLVRVTNRYQAGRAKTDHEAIIADLAKRAGIETRALEQLIASHTKPGAPYRVFRPQFSKE